MTRADGPLAGRTVIVTGAGRGIGAASAQLMAEQGAQLVLNDLGVSLDGTDREVASIGPLAAAPSAAVMNDGSDIADFEQAEALIAATISRFGRLDAIVNFAGIVRDRMIFNMTEDEWEAVIRVHLKGAFNLARHASAYWREHRGGDYRLVNVISGAGLFGAPGQPNYAAAKMGVVGLTLSCANALQRYGVASIAAAPGAQTRMSATINPQVAERVGMAGDAMRPENVAAGFAYLAGPRSAWLNGQIVGFRGHQLQLYSGVTTRLEVVGAERWTYDTIADALETHFRPVVEGRGIFDREPS
jgi:NAD(P)-dependent dehydrogenase (short-subunit alcohol dehydrogenase family)